MTTFGARLAAAEVTVALIALPIIALLIAIATVALIPLAIVAALVAFAVVALLIPIPTVALIIIALAAVTIVALLISFSVVALLVSLTIVAGLRIAPEFFTTRLLAGLRRSFVGFAVVAHVVVALRHAELGRRLRLRRAVQRHQPEIMLRMLKKILGENAIAAGLSVARQNDISIVDLVGRTADPPLRPITVELLVPKVRITAASWIAAAARSTRVQTMPLTLCVARPRFPPSLRNFRSISDRLAI